jgi:hypothetical protein
VWLGLGGRFWVQVGGRRLDLNAVAGDLPTHLGGFRAGVGLGFRFGLGFRLLRQQRLTVGDGDLIVVGMDFAEGQEAVPVAAVVDEGRLQRRLYTGYLGKIDIAAQRLARG